MKNLIFCVSLLISFAAFGSEIQVMNIEARSAGRGSLTTRFEVFMKNNMSGVTLRVTKRTGGKHPHTSRRTFSKAVPELSLNGNTLELNMNGKIVDCGTMGETRVFKLPVLKLSGHCDVVAKRINGKVLVSIIAE